MKAKVLIFVALLHSCCSLTASPELGGKSYNAEEYKSELEAVQSSVEKNLKEIRGQIEQIHGIIDNATLSDDQRLTKLSEAMADERDSLYRTQQILKVPFSLRSCKCAALDNQTREEINTKVKNIGASIQKMKDSLRNCTFDRCPRYE